MGRLPIPSRGLFPLALSPSVYRATGVATLIIAFCAARDAAEWAAAIGAVAYIGKPFDVEDLERLVVAQLPAIA